MVRAARKARPEQSLWPLIQLDMDRVIKQAKLKYQRDHLVKVNLHPMFPVEQLARAEDAVYQVWIMGKDAAKEEWRLGEQGMLPALLRAFKSCNSWR